MATKWKNFICGLTTNPLLLQKEYEETKIPKEDILKKLCHLIQGPVSIEVNAIFEKDMMKEADEYLSYAPNVCIKLPATPDGLRACKTLSRNNIKTNVTLCFSVFQALAAAHAGATFVSPFIGRLDDCGESGIQTLKDILNALSPYPKTSVLAASLRDLTHIHHAAVLNCHFATIPPHLFETLFVHPLTQKGLEQFRKCASL